MHVSHTSKRRPTHRKLRMYRCCSHAGVECVTKGVQFPFPEFDPTPSRVLGHVRVAMDSSSRRYKPSIHTHLRATYRQNPGQSSLSWLRFHEIRNQRHENRHPFGSCATATNSAYCSAGSLCFLKDSLTKSKKEPPHVGDGTFLLGDASNSDQDTAVSTINKGFF